jgi:sedoheptulokinase
MRFFTSVGKELFGIDEAPDLYERMQTLAERSGGSLGLRIEPLFSGSRSQPASRGSVEGLSFENFRPGPLIFGMQEGIIALLKAMIDPRLLESRPYLVGSGNGLRRNPLLRDITARMFKRELLIPRIAEEAAVGAALNGAVAAGVYSDFEETRKLIQYEERTG